MFQGLFQVRYIRDEETKTYPPGMYTFLVLAIFTYPSPLKRGYTLFSVGGIFGLTKYMY